MKRIFNRSTPTTIPYREQEPEEQTYLPPPSLRPGGSPRASKYTEHHKSWSKPESASSLQSSNTDTNLRRQSSKAGRTSSPTSARQSASRAAPGGIGSKAYPSYGEVQIDSHANRGGGQVHRDTVDPTEAVYHQDLPARSAASQSSRHNHLRSRSNISDRPTQSPRQQSHLPPKQMPAAVKQPLPNPYEAAQNAAQLDERTGESRGFGGVTGRMNSISRRGSQSQSRRYHDASSGRPVRRPSLQAGADSSIYGGFASAATANAEIEEHNLNDVALRPEARYVDRFSEIRTPQSAAIGTGVDKMKRKLFGRKKKEEKAEDDAASQGSEAIEAWAKVERPESAELFEQSVRLPVPRSSGEQRSDQGHAHSPWYSSVMHLNKQQQTESVITGQIGLLCITDDESWDWSQVNALCDAISRSEAASKEAARALRKEFKYGENVPRYRAVRLWAVICTRSSDRFRLQVANKKFLDVLEDLYSDKKTSTAVQGRLLLAWSMLANEYQLDQDLSPITRIFNKIKPNDMPANGVPLDRSNQLFNPPHDFSRPKVQVQQDLGGQISTTYLETEAHSQLHNERSGAPPAWTFTSVEESKAGPAQTNTVFEQPGATQTTVIRSTSISHRGPPTDEHSAAVSAALFAASYEHENAAEQVPRLSDDIRRLHQECQVARGNAQVLTDALVEHGLQSDLVTEFAVKTQMSQEFILAQIPWASAQADRSRNVGLESVASTEVSMETQNAGRVSREEGLIQDLLETHEKLTVATSMVEEARARQQEEEEERQVIDRSMREQRIDRSALLQDAQTGHIFSLENSGRTGLAPPMARMQASSSGSRSASPATTEQRRPLPIPGSGDALLSANAGFAMQKSHSSPSNGAAAPLANGNASSLRAPEESALTASAVYNSGAKEALRTSKSMSGPRPMNEYPSATLLVDGIGSGVPTGKTDDDDDDDSDDSIIKTPVAPSAKALGKRRAMSIHDGLATDTSAAASVPDLSDRVNQMQLNHSHPQLEQTLRARPPPALPTLPLEQNHSNNPFLQQQSNIQHHHLLPHSNTTNNNSNPFLA